ncbi:MAG: hypothetical protein ACKOW3_08665, partial [Hyphomicrobium sp.]
RVKSNCKVEITYPDPNNIKPRVQLCISLLRAETILVTSSLLDRLFLARQSVSRGMILFPFQRDWVGQFLTSVSRKI